MHAQFEPPPPQFWVAYPHSHPASFLKIPEPPTFNAKFSSSLEFYG